MNPEITKYSPGSRVFLLLSLFLGGFGQVHATALPSEWPGSDSDWIAEESDNICGISSPKKISNPAKVDYHDIWEATPEIKEMKRKGIDPNSPKGKALRNQAKTRITKACEEVRAKKYCGVWRTIEHKDGRKVPDLTDEVKARF